MTGRGRSIRQATCTRTLGWLVTFVLFSCQSQSRAHGDNPPKPSVLQLTLAPQTANDSHIKLLAPPVGSADKVEFTADGLHVKQVVESGAGAKTSGFAVNVKSAESFAFMVSFAVQKLDPPRASRAQGFWIRLAFDGDQSVAFGLVASSKTKRALGSTTAYTDSPKLKFQVEPLDFNQGTWLIERKGDELRLAVGETQASFREVKRLPSPPGGLKEIQVLCSRFSSGNTPAEYTFKSITFASTDYLHQPPPKPALITLSRMIWGLVYTGAFAGLVFGSIKLYPIVLAKLEA